MSQKRLQMYAVIVMALIVCMSGILILPQVDLPDFTMTSAQSFSGCLAHGWASCSSASPEARAVLQDAREILSWVKVSVVFDGDATLPLPSLSAFRC